MLGFSLIQWVCAGNSSFPCAFSSFSTISVPSAVPNYYDFLNFQMLKLCSIYVSINSVIIFIIIKLAKNHMFYQNNTDQERQTEYLLIGIRINSSFLQKWIGTNFEICRYNKLWNLCPESFPILNSFQMNL